MWELKQDIENHLKHKQQIAENFDNTYKTIIYDKSEEKLSNLLNNDTIEYFNQFDSSILEDLQENLEHLIDLTAVKNYKLAINEINNIDITDYSETTEKILLDNWNFYRNEYLEDDLTILKKKLRNY